MQFEILRISRPDCQVEAETATNSKTKSYKNLQAS